MARLSDWWRLAVVVVPFAIAVNWATGGDLVRLSVTVAAAFWWRMAGIWADKKSAT